MDHRDRSRQVLRTVVDVVLTGVLASISWGLVTEVSATSSWMPRAVVQALAVAHVLPVAVRRRAPLAALLASLAVAVAIMTTGIPLVRLGPAVLVLTYALATARPRRTSVPATALTVVAVALSVPVGGFGYDLATMGWFAALVLIAWVLGETVRQREVATETLRERAQQLEAARGELAKAAVAAERLRIAREMHDIVAHGLSVIAVHAGSGRLAAPRDAAAAAEALATIERTSRATLDEMRGLLGVLREQGEQAATAPLPDLGGLADLVASFRDAGLPVALDVDGDLQGLAPGLGLTAYRLVQEALTNVLKHAGPVETSVTVRAAPESLTVEVRDLGQGGRDPAVGVGHGTVGMRERVAVYGGQLAVGPDPAGGWRVHASLPRTAVRA